MNKKIKKYNSGRREVLKNIDKKEAMNQKMGKVTSIWRRFNIK